jgi:uncharacterized OB-fold protein
MTDTIATTPSSAFTKGLQMGVLRYQHCAACGVAQTLARYACRQCGSDQLIWRDAVGTGRVYACTVVTRAPSDEFRALAPYTLALVDLDEGFRLMAHASPGVAIGDAVVAEFFEHQGRQLIRFVPQRA